MKFFKNILYYLFSSINISSDIFIIFPLLKCKKTLIEISKKFLEKIHNFCKSSLIILS